MPHLGHSNLLTFWLKPFSGGSTALEQNRQPLGFNTQFCVTCSYHLSSLTWPCAHTTFQSCPPLSALHKCPGLCPRAFVALAPLLGAPLLPLLSCSSWTSTCSSDFCSTRNPSDKLPLINKVFLSQAHSILGWTKWSRHVCVGQSSQNGQFLMVQPNTHCTRFLGLLLTNHYKISSLKHKNWFSRCSGGQKC